MCQSQQGKNQLNERREEGVGVTSCIKLSLPPKAREKLQTLQQ